MRTSQGWPIGICNWSLRMDINSVIKVMNDLDVEHVHLAVGPAMEEGGELYLRVAKEHQWTITATMIDFPQEDYSTLESIRKTGGIMPDSQWPKNRERFIQATEITKDLGSEYITMHAGFLEHEDPALLNKFYQRVNFLADEAKKKDLTLLLETGQETGEEMRRFMEEINHPYLGINFDPANIILYDKGDPIDALKVLAPYVKHVHIKDAMYTDATGTWGAEVPWGEGQVGHQRFLNALGEIEYSGALAVEREAGEDRVGDVKWAVESLSQ